MKITKRVRKWQRASSVVLGSILLIPAAILAVDILVNNKGAKELLTLVPFFITAAIILILPRCSRNVKTELPGEYAIESLREEFLTETTANERALLSFN